jgi:hypothetical protein
MQKIQQDAECGFRAFLDKFRNLGQDVRVTLAQFDHVYEILWENVPIRDVPLYHLEPRGTTALLDAVGHTLQIVGQRLARTPEEERPSKVVVVIVTDGHENQSMEYTRAVVRQMIEHQTTKYNWQFAYLGANQDSFAEAGAIGVRTSGALNYMASGAGVRCAYASAAEVVSNYVVGNTLNVDFSKVGSGTSAKTDLPVEVSSGSGT